MMNRKTVSEISLLPENSDPITTVQSTIEVNRRRRKTLALDCCCAGATGGSGISGQATNPEFHCQFPFAERVISGCIWIHHRLAGAHVLPLLPTGGEGWGEEATFIDCPSARPSPHSCLAGRGRKFLLVVSRCTHLRSE